jgi:hypothetical protein
MPEVLYREKAKAAHVGTYEYAGGKLALNKVTLRRKKHLPAAVRLLHRSRGRWGGACSTNCPSRASCIGGCILGAADA